MRDWMMQARKSCNLTMKETADRLGISESYYSMIERGERQSTMDIALASRLSAVFGVSIEYIVEQESSSATP